MTFAKIAMNEASATPIMSAAAVAAVRAGRRDALWAASEPEHAGDAPDRPGEHGHEHRDEPAGERRDRAEQSDRAQGDQEQAGADASGVAEVPSESAEPASTSEVRPATSERRRGRLRAATESRRLTAGATRRRERRDGAATSVTPMPTIRLGDERGRP